MPLQPLDLLLDDLCHLQRRLAWLADDAQDYSHAGLHAKIRQVADALLPLVTALQAWQRAYQKETTP